MKLLSINDFINYISTLKVLRKITKIQLHHTWSPNYTHFNGSNHITLQKNMRNYHVNSCGWSDIAQHFTIFPDGKIVTGRSLEVSPAGIANANSGSICIECLGNFDKGGDVMREEQKTSIVCAIRALIDKFGLDSEDGVTYHAWWDNSGNHLGTYISGKSQKTCPGTNFIGGNTRQDYETHLKPLIDKSSQTIESLKPIESINDIIWELGNSGIIINPHLWIKKCEEDINVYWLCRKMANKLRGTL